MIEPQKLLEIARVVEPGINWKIHNGIVYESSKETRVKTYGGCYYFEPYEDTERGKAQLMEVVFALCGVEISSAQVVNLKIYLQCRAVDRILNLAHEVLVCTSN